MTDLVLITVLLSGVLLLTWVRRHRARDRARKARAEAEQASKSARLLADRERMVRRAERLEAVCWGHASIELADIALAREVLDEASPPGLNPHYHAARVLCMADDKAAKARVIDGLDNSATRRKCIQALADCDVPSAAGAVLSTIENEYIDLLQKPEIVRYLSTHASMLSVECLIRLADRGDAVGLNVMNARRILLRSLERTAANIQSASLGHIARLPPVRFSGGHEYGGPGGHDVFEGPPTWHDTPVLRDAAITELHRRGECLELECTQGVELHCTVSGCTSRTQPYLERTQPQVLYRCSVCQSVVCDMHMTEGKTAAGEPCRCCPVCTYRYSPADLECRRLV